MPQPAKSHDYLPVLLDQIEHTGQLSVDARRKILGRRRDRIIGHHAPVVGGRGNSHQKLEERYDHHDAGVGQSEHRLVPLLLR